MAISLWIIFWSIRRTKIIKTPKYSSLILEMALSLMAKITLLPTWLAGYLPNLLNPEKEAATILLESMPTCLEDWHSKFYSKLLLVITNIIKYLRIQATNFRNWETEDSTKQLLRKSRILFIQTIISAPNNWMKNLKCKIITINQKSCRNLIKNSWP